MEINGMAHVILTVSDFEASLPFYRKLLPLLGMKPVIDSKDMFYCVGGRTALGIMPSEEKYRGEKFVQRRVGPTIYVSGRAPAKMSTRRIN
jgi:catechol 2,3-dioxygenase-like lactoylglutathione lyase family enzyme